VIGPNGLLAEKARLLCTNNITYVNECDELVMLRAGSILQRSTFKQCNAQQLYIDSLSVAANPKQGIAADTDISRLVQEFGRATPRPGSPASDPDSEETAVMAESQEKSTRSRRNSAMTRRASLLSPAEQAKAIRQSARNPKKAKETRAVGSVKSQVYTEYVKANGVPGVIVYLVTLGLVQFLSIMTNVWLKNWSQVCYQFPCAAK
jgi:ATP-binding cassette subfamily C (CFTR/MRP) protein 1